MEWVKRALWSLKLPRNHYIRYGWYEIFFARLLISAYVAQHLIYCTPDMPQNYPTGLTKLLGIDFRPVCSLSTWFFPWMAFFLGVLWACQRFEAITSGLMTFLLVAYGTARNSSGGIHHGTQIVTMSVLTQFLTHLKFRWIKEEEGLDEGSYCMYIAQQTVAAGYLVCAIMKTVNTGGGWLLETPNLLVSLITLNEREGYSKGRTPSFVTDVITPIMFDYPFTAVLFFSPGYFFEIGFPILLWGNRKAHLLGGIAVYMMHVFIFIVMRLSFGSFQLLLIALFVNIPYWIRQIVDRIRGTGASSPIVVPSSSKIHHNTEYYLDSEVESSANTWRLGSIWRKIPCKTMLILVVICFIARDRAYPFSHFPMYSTPTPVGTYFYLTASHGVNDTLHPLKTTYFFMKTSAQVKKYHWKACMGFWRPQGIRVESWIDDIEKFSKCGNLTLNYLLTMARPNRKKFLSLYDHIQLHWVTLKYSKWKFTRDDAIVADLTLDEFRKTQFSKSQLRKMAREAQERLGKLKQEEESWDKTSFKDESSVIHREEAT